MTFKITKKRMYHFPHNTLFVGELIFLLKSLDLNKRSYSFKEVVTHLFNEEIDKGVFAKFHRNMPNKIIHGGAPDVKAIKSKFASIKKSKKKPNGMPDELFKEIMSLSLDEATNYFIKKRSSDSAKNGLTSILNFGYLLTFIEELEYLNSISISSKLILS